MVDPTRTLILEIESDVGRLPSGKLEPGGAILEPRFKELFGRSPPPGYAAFIARHDGGTLAPEVRVLSWAESVRRVEEAERAGETTWKGLWPVVDRGPRLFAIDAEAGADGEWPVVEVADRTVDRAGTSFLRFLHTLLAELAAPAGGDVIALTRERCRRDPGLSSHWVELADELDHAGQRPEMERAVADGLRSATPPGPALAFAAALLAHDRADQVAAEAALEDTLTLEPLDARDDDARLDAAALTMVFALDRADQGAVKRSRDLLGPAAASTGAFWRSEAMRAWSTGDARRAELAARVAQALLPDDADIGRMQLPSAQLAPALKALGEAREALERGQLDDALQKARTAASERSDLGICQAVLAEVLNARHDRGALAAAQRATALNPALVEAWRELGDAHLEAHQAVKAEEAYRQAIARDATYGFGMAKLAQALLEQGRALEALEAINAAGERGSDPFFLAAVRGDVFAEMSRHGEAAEAYDVALRIEPEDHWVLHQAAIEHSRAGNDARAAELFERALTTDREGCHQTLIDYGDLLRKTGRIGDAVRLYRKAVAANPSDTEWRQMLREAERELMGAPN